MKRTREKSDGRKGRKATERYHADVDPGEEGKDPELLKRSQVGQGNSRTGSGRISKDPEIQHLQPVSLEAHLTLARLGSAAASIKSEAELNSSMIKYRSPGPIADVVQSDNQSPQSKPVIIVKFPPPPIIVKLPPPKDLPSTPQKDLIQSRQQDYIEETDLKDQVKEKSSIAAVRPTDQSVGHPNQLENQRFPPGSTFGENESSAGTKKTSWTSPISSTVPTSVSNTTRSWKRPNLNSGIASDQTIGRRQPLPVIDEVSQPMPAENLWDTHSTVTADSVELSMERKEDIIRRFTEAILREIPNQFVIYHNPHKSTLSFRQKFQSLVKDYSTKVKDDTPQRSQKKAAKQIRILRHDISERCEKALLSTSAYRRVYPDIMKEAEKAHIPEKTWGEKVDDWNMSPLEHTPTFEFSPDDAPAARSFADTPQSTGEDKIPVGFWDVSPSCSLTSLSDGNITGSDVQAPAVIHIDSSEDRAIYEYLTTHTAFRELVADVEKLVEHYCSNKLEFIRHRVALSLKRIRSIDEYRNDFYRIVLKFEWDLLGFLQEQFSSGVTQELGSLLAITGQANDAYCSTVQVYLERTWPNHPTALLKTIQSALHSEKKRSSFDSRTQRSSITVNLPEQTIEIAGSEEFIVAISQQLAWLVAACRASDVGLAYSYLSFHEEILGSQVHLPAFRLDIKLVQIPLEECTSCWNELVGNSAVVPGFPIPERRHGEVGLEISLDIMAGLGGMPLATLYDGGYLLKGRSLIFVPVERRGNSIQWHLIKKTGIRIKYKDVAELCPLRLSDNQLDGNGLSSTRAFLGWCPIILNNLGTTLVTYSNIRYSTTRTPSKRVVALTGGSVGFSQIGSGTLNFAIGLHNGPYTAEQSTHYSDILDDAKQIHVILQDMEQRCAWQTDGERAILNIILHRHAMGVYTIDGGSVNLQAADAEIPSTVRQTMLQNADIAMVHGQCIDKSAESRKRFKDQVGELYKIIEGLQDHTERMTTAGIQMKLDWMAHIHGYEYMDLFQRKHKIQIKEAQLRKSCGQWPGYARDINAVVLFGTGFGDVFEPDESSELCHNFQTTPKDKDYLMVEVFKLRELYRENGSLESHQQLTATGTRWHRSKHLFENCTVVKLPGKKSTSCACDRIQEFVPRASFRKLVKDPGPLLDSGAAIFGNGGGSSRWLSNVRGSFRQKQNTDDLSRPNAHIYFGRSRKKLQRGLNESERQKEILHIPQCREPIMKSPELIEHVTRGKMPNSEASFPSPRMRYRRYPSYGTESTSINTLRSSNTGTNSHPLMTPTTSDHTSWDQNHVSFSMPDPSIKSRTENCATNPEPDEKLTKTMILGSESPNPITARRMTYSDVFRCSTISRGNLPVTTQLEYVDVPLSNPLSNPHTTSTRQTPALARSKQDTSFPNNGASQELQAAGDGQVQQFHSLSGAVLPLDRWQDPSRPSLRRKGNFNQHEIPRSVLEGSPNFSNDGKGKMIDKTVHPSLSGS